MKLNRRSFLASSAVLFGSTALPVLAFPDKKYFADPSLKLQTIDATPLGSAWNEPKIKNPWPLKVGQLSVSGSLKDCEIVSFPVGVKSFCVVSEVNEVDTIYLYYSWGFEVRFISYLGNDQCRPVDLVKVVKKGKARGLHSFACEWSCDEEEEKALRQFLFDRRTKKALESLQG